MPVLPVKAAYCGLLFLCFIGVYLSVIVIMQGYIFLFNVSQPTVKATGCEILFYMVLYSAGSWFISQEKQVVMAF